MLITKEIEIDMAHRVPSHNGKCRSVHGHRYRIEVGVDDKIVIEKGRSDEGMVIDFSDLKKIMMDEIDELYDHNSIFSAEDPILNLVGEIQRVTMQPKKIIIVGFIPTAENLARHWYEVLEPKLQEKDIAIHHVKVWETPSSTATYGK